ncbi:MAG: SOS response-associated peptidase [Alphaproteobacteria bacterium]
MCGRYKQIRALQDYLELLGIKMTGEGAGVLAPGMMAPVVTQLGLAAMYWGLTPAWSKEDAKTQVINARAETMHDKPFFRNAKRCLVPVDAFIEWDRSQKPSQAFDISLPAPFAFAGLWDSWINPATGEVKNSFAILTTAPTEQMAKIHHRMPAILATASECRAWMNMEIKTPQTYTAEPLIIAPAEAKPKKETAQLSFL